MFTKQIKSGALFSYVAIMLNIILTLLYTPWMIDKVGMSAYGLYTLANSLIAIFMMDFGLSAAATRYLAKYKAENNQPRLNTFLGAIFKLYIILDLVILPVLIVVYLCLGKIYVGLNSAELEQLKILFLIISGFSLLAFPATPLNGILSAYEQFAPLKLCDLFHKISSVVFVVGVLLVSNNVAAVVSANIVSSLLTIILKIVIIQKRIPIKIQWTTEEKGIYKEIFSFSVWTTVMGISQRLTYNLAPSILAITCSSIAVSLYSPASALGSYYYTFATAINGLFLPTISRMIASDKEEEITPLMIKIGRYHSVTLGLILIGFISVGDCFIRLWLGVEFSQSYWCTILIMIPAFFEYSQQIANTTIIAKNYVKDQAIVYFSTSVIGLAMAYLLSIKWETIGLCVALMVVGLLRVIGLNYIHKKKLNIQIEHFYFKTYFPILLPLLITGVISRLFVHFLGSINWAYLVLEIAVCTLLFLGCIWCFVLQKEERRQILSRLGGKKKSE